MIHTISYYLYRIHREKELMKVQAEQRRAMKLLLGIVACVTISVILWILY